MIQNILVIVSHLSGQLSNDFVQSRDGHLVMSIDGLDPLSCFLLAQVKELKQNDKNNNINHYLILNTDTRTTKDHRENSQSFFYARGYIFVEN